MNNNADLISLLTHLQPCYPYGIPIQTVSDQKAIFIFNDSIPLSAEELTFLHSAIINGLKWDLSAVVIIGSNQLLEIIKGKNISNLACILLGQGLADAVFSSGKIEKSNFNIVVETVTITQAITDKNFKRQLWHDLQKII